MKYRLSFVSILLSLLICNIAVAAEQQTPLDPITDFRVLNIPKDPTSSDGVRPPNWPWRGVVIHSCCGEAGPEDIALLSDMNVNAVMLNLKVRFQAETQKINPQLAWSKSLAWADSMLDACRENGITGNIRLNEIPIDPSYGLTEKSPGFWDSEERYSEAVTFAGKLAEHFKARGNELGAYTILSEPSRVDGDTKVQPTVWPALQNKILAAIRKHDPIRYVVVTPGLGGLPSNYSAEDFRPFSDSKIIYGAHMYLPHAFTHQGIQDRPSGYTYPGIINLRYVDKNFLAKALAPLRTFQQQHEALVWIGEFSAVNGATGAEQYIADLIALFDDYEWSWTYFSYKANPLWNPSNDMNLTKKDPLKPMTSLTTPRWEILKSAFSRNK